MKVLSKQDVDLVNQDSGMRYSPSCKIVDPDAPIYATTSHQAILRSSAALMRLRLVRCMALVFKQMVLMAQRLLSASVWVLKSSTCGRAGNQVWLSFFEAG